jgi:prefoldin beta subunit
MTALPDNPKRYRFGGRRRGCQFREMQEEVQKLHSDMQTLQGQETENEMVLQELDLLSEDSSVYKMIGPVLNKQDNEDSARLFVSD